MKINYYHSGTKSEINLNHINKIKIQDLAGDLINGAKEVLRVYVDEEGLNQLKENEEIIEIFFYEGFPAGSEEFKNFNIKKILIPLTGEFAGTDETQIVSLFIGEDEYLTNPFAVNDGYLIVKELADEIKDSLKK